MRTPRRLALAGFALLAAACEGTYNPQPERPFLAPALVAGLESSGVSVGNSTPNLAWLWSSAGRADLTPRTQGAYASAVACAGADVYAAGAVDIGAYGDAAAYWKNGTAVVLTDGTSQDSAQAILVAGADVYVAGQYRYHPAYWRNGSAVVVSDGAFPNGGWGAGTARAIALSGGDVLVAGDEVTEVEVAPSSYVSTNSARLWRNGVATNLTDGLHGAQALGLAVSGGDVHVAGFEADDAGYFLATVWKNGVAQRLPQGSFGAVATSIALAGADVYVAGYQGNGSTVFATYWKNGVPVALGDGNRESAALSIAVVETGGGLLPVRRSVMVAGYQGNTAMLWRDGVATALSDGKQFATATGVSAACR